MEMAVIKFDFRNIITISLCAGAGYMLFLGLYMLLGRVQAMRAGGAS